MIKGCLMGLWLLSFSGRCNADGIGRASHFDEGFAIDPACAGQIPPSLVGRQLSGDEAADLLTLLMIESKGEPVVFAN
jgi:hypothetical protein